jgi:hypothetical protein
MKFGFPYHKGKYTVQNLRRQSSHLNDNHIFTNKNPVFDIIITQKRKKTTEQATQWNTHTPQGQQQQQQQQPCTYCT